MKWLLGVVLLLCTGTLSAQSLGEVARAQRNGENGPKAKRVVTNADFAAASDETPPIQSDKPRGIQTSPPAKYTIRKRPCAVRSSATARRRTEPTSAAFGDRH